MPRAQIALKVTFEANELGQAEVEAADLPAGLLEAAHLDTVRLAKGSPVIDQRISELELRANTGVSIVGIERDGERIVNPGPEETLLEGDRLLLLGEDTQLTQGQGRVDLRPRRVEGSTIRTPRRWRAWPSALNNLLGGGCFRLELREEQDVSNALLSKQHHD